MRVKYGGMIGLLFLKEIECNAGSVVMDLNCRNLECEMQPTHTAQTCFARPRYCHTLRAKAVQMVCRSSEGSLTDCTLANKLRRLLSSHPSSATLEEGRTKRIL